MCIRDRLYLWSDIPKSLATSWSSQLLFTSQVPHSIGWSVKTNSTIFFLRSVKFSLLVKICWFSPTGVWQDATTFVGPSFSKATSTEQTRQAPYGARLGSSHKVGTFFSPR